MPDIRQAIFFATGKPKTGPRVGAKTYKMKKFISFFLFAVILCSTQGYSQQWGGGCSHKDNIRKMVKAADTLARFMDYVKGSVSPTTWSNFISAGTGGTDSTEAFDEFGFNGITWKATFQALSDSLEYYQRILAETVNENEQLSETQLEDSLIGLVTCYLADTVENDVTELVKRGFGQELNNMQGPCEVTMRGCMSSAAQAYASNVIQCGLGGIGGVGVFKSGWIGSLIGFGCFLYANSSYNSAKWSCMGNYVDCLDPQ